MPLSEFPQLLRPEPPEAILHPPPIRLDQDRVRVRERKKGLDQQGALRLPALVDSMGPREIAQDRVRQEGERVLQGVGRRGTSFEIEAPGPR